MLPSLISKNGFAVLPQQTGKPIKQQYSLPDEADWDPGIKKQKKQWRIV